MEKNKIPLVPMASGHFAAKFGFRTLINCVKIEYQNVLCAQQHEPLQMSELQRGPWLKLSMDFCGPIPTGAYLLVLVD